MTERTQVVSTHWFRRTARARERRLEAALGDARARGRPLPETDGVPVWAEHVRVQRYRGPQRGRWAVMATART